MMSDEKIFALEESQKGGWWCSPGDADPTVMTWQGDTKYYILEPSRPVSPRVHTYTSAHTRVHYSIKILPLK